MQGFRQAGRRRGGARRGDGFSLVEIAISIAILTVAISGIAGSILSAHAMNRVNQETALAQEAVQRTLEEMRTRPFDEIFAAYNSVAGDDAGLTAPAAGSGFAVLGLDPQAGDPDGLCGRVEFPSVINGAVEDLFEGSDDARLGMPRDLDGDLILGELVPEGTYELLPVRVIVEWRGVRGNRSWAVETMLCRP